MTSAADLVLTNVDGHTLTDPDETFGAVAARNGRIVRVGRTDEIDHLTGVETREIDCEGRTLLPGFVDAHTHLPMVGRRIENAALGTVADPEAAVAALTDHASATDREWVLGFGYDESAWPESRYLRRADLDRVSTDRPVVAFREDMHVASLNTAALERLRPDMPDGDVHTEDGGTDASGGTDAGGGNPTGVVVEEAVDVVWEAVRPDRERMTTLVQAAQARANELGVTCVHDMVRQSAAPAVYRALDVAGDLTLRVRINYWSDHLEAVEELGLRTNHGSDMVRVGAIKTFTDGSIGGRTAKLSAPYADAPGETERRTDGEFDDDTDDARGQWVVDPAELREIVDRADDLDVQVTAHAIGDEAIAETLAAFEEVGGGDAASPDSEVDGARHRIEHAEVLTDDLVERLGASDVVVSAQPNFLKWARADGLYAARLGDERRLDSNRYADLLAAGAEVAFGSDCMPLDPLFGVQQAVTAPVEGQRLDVTEALRAYTRGGAYAGFDEHRLGTVETGKRVDLVVLERSPWAVDPEEIGDIGVALTLVDGEVVFDGRE